MTRDPALSRSASGDERRTPWTNGSLTTLPIRDALTTLASVVAPVAARGAIVRRPRAVALAERVGADTRAVRRLRLLRERYGSGPVVVRVPGRRFAFVLDPQDVDRVLHGSPQPFSPSTREKRGALGHFQPEGVLISSPQERLRRRPFVGAVLDEGSPVHRLAGPMANAVREEAAALLHGVEETGELDWATYAETWWRCVRRVVLGDAARDDQAVTDDLLVLRRRANWSFLAHDRPNTRERFLRRVGSYVEAAEPGSLASLVKTTPAAPGTERVQQVPQWLFAFDAMAWASFRALGLLATHPGAVDRVRAEAPEAPDRPYLRATLLESLRLWPTTPAILRDTTEPTAWGQRMLPAGASVVVFAPLFHRDESRLPEAHRFAPELWLRERSADDWPLVPFSAGPGMCPGRNVVLLVGSVMLGALVDRHDWVLTRGRLDASGSLPGTLSPFGLRFTPRAG